MREIKYRFWDTWNECFTYSGTNMIRFFGLYEQTLIGDNKPILEQYTGLEDKNGKEIYEGDVLDFEGLILVIQFKCGMFCYSYNSSDLIKLYNTHFEWNNGQSDILKIIGNIHENPKLIK